MKVGDFGLAMYYHDKDDDDDDSYDLIQNHHINSRTRIPTTYKKLCGTPNYIAPEILLLLLLRSKVQEEDQSSSLSLLSVNQLQDGKKPTIGYEVDVWSIGIVCYTLVVGKTPFEAKDIQSTFQRILFNQYSFPKHISLSDKAKQIIAMILEFHPTHRCVIYIYLFLTCTVFQYLILPPPIFSCGVDPLLYKLQTILFS